MKVQSEITLSALEIREAIKDYIWKCMDFKGPQHNLEISIASLNIEYGKIYLNSKKL